MVKPAKIRYRAGVNSLLGSEYLDYLKYLLAGFRWPVAHHPARLRVPSASLPSLTSTLVAVLRICSTFLVPFRGQVPGTGCRDQSLTQRTSHLLLHHRTLVQVPTEITGAFSLPHPITKSCLTHCIPSPGLTSSPTSQLLPSCLKYFPYPRTDGLHYPKWRETNQPATLPCPPQ